MGLTSKFRLFKPHYSQASGYLSFFRNPCLCIKIVRICRCLCFVYSDTDFVPIALASRSEKGVRFRRRYWPFFYARDFSKISKCLGRGSNRGPFDLKANSLLRPYKSGLFRKAVQVYDIPKLYPVNFKVYIMTLSLQ